MRLLRKLVNLILYSSLWIALCAASQVQLTYVLIGIPQGPDPYTLFVLMSTIGLYGVHRLVGIKIVSAFEHEGRFAVIKKYRSHITVYCIIGFLSAGVLFFFLAPFTWLYLMLPVAISAAYVFPTGNTRKRLRDIPFIKIFLLAMSWSMLTTTVPLLSVGHTEWISLLLIFLERLFFIIAITIPFDIRDMDVDKDNGLLTIPHVLNVTRSKYLALILLAISAAITAMMMVIGIYPIGIQWPFALFLVVTALIIWGSRPGRSDLYYSGLLDGTMLFLYVLVMFHLFYVHS